MQEKPILFQGDMVRAILAGDKTQTRRIVKKQPPDSAEGIFYYSPPGGRSRQGWVDPGIRYYIPGTGLRIDPCPFGQVGDRLWVREKWKPDTAGSCSTIHYAAGNMHIPIKNTAEAAERWVAVRRAAEQYPHLKPPEWRPSIHMPRWACRLVLRITGIRVERLQEISGQDAIAEGIAKTEHWTPAELDGRPFDEKWWDDFHFWNHYPQIPFQRLWNQINGNWEVNPWVWVVEFEIFEGVASE